MKKIIGFIFLIFVLTSCIDNGKKDISITNEIENTQNQNKTISGVEGELDIIENNKINIITENPKDNEEVININDIDYYTNKKLGIRFKIQFINKNEIKVNNNKIYRENEIIVGKGNVTNIIEYEDIEYMYIFNIKEEETVEEVILREITLNGGTNIGKCEVINKGIFWGNENYNKYIIDLIDKNIVYTKEELERIELADVEANGGPFNGEWMEKVIYNERLTNYCSNYAEPLGLGLSKTIGSYFIYNNKNKLVFLPGRVTPSFFIDESIEIYE